MDLSLAPEEIRVLGCLIEKEMATPDQYPLSLAGLTAACNQKTSREPVLSLSEQQVQAAVDALVRQHLVGERNPSGSRVAKYAHRLSPSLGLSFDFSREELALLAVLMLRGPQTSGELRTRSERLCRLEDVAQVERLLGRLAEHERGPYVRTLPRQPGQRETRYVQLFGDAPAEAVAPTPSTAPPTRLEEIEARVEMLEEELRRLRQAVEHLVSE